MRRAIAALVCVVFVLLLAPAAAFADDVRTYDSGATGAPRAVGRSEATVQALVDAAKAATSGYTFGELAATAPGDKTIPNVVHVGQFGAYGDGIHDDRDALQAAFDSGAAIVLFEHGNTYKVNKSLHVTHGNITILGDNATILTDASYSDTDERLLSVHGKVPPSELRDTVANDWQNYPEYYIEDVGVYHLNLKSCPYDPTEAPLDKKYYDPEHKIAYVQQLMVQMASNVDVFGCTLTIERPADGQLVDGRTALDAYTGWHNLTVENCTVRDECDDEGGGGMWIRDHFNMGSSNIVFKGNDLLKRCHDEILAVFNTAPSASVEARRPITDVLIAENKFVMDEGKASSSVMAFTVKSAHDVLIENNQINVKTTGGLVWSDYSSNVVVRDNDIMQIRSHIVDGSTTNFLMFRNEVALVENNRIALSGVDETSARNDVYVFATNGTVRDNDVTLDLNLGYVASGVSAVENNKIRLDGPVHVLFNGCRAITGNEVKLNAHANQYFQYFRTTFTSDVLIEQNTFDSQAQDETHTVLNLNDAKLGGHVVRFAENRVLDSDLASGSRLLFLQLTDDEPQENCVLFLGNEIPKLSTYDRYVPKEIHTYVWPKTANEGGDHNWGEPIYIWAEDNGSCTARRVCANNPSHVDEETVGTTAVVTREATYTQGSETTYTAAFDADYFATQTKTVEGEALSPGTNDQDEQGDQDSPAPTEEVAETTPTDTEMSTPTPESPTSAAPKPEDPASAAPKPESPAPAAPTQGDTSQVESAPTQTSTPESENPVSAAPTPETTPVEPPQSQGGAPGEARYARLDGEDSTWVRGSNEDLRLTFKRDSDDGQALSHFKGIKVDGSDVDRSCFEAKAGSVVVTLHADYLQTLAAGKHELQALFDDGNDPVTAFEIQEKPSASGNSVGSPGASSTTPHTGSDASKAAVPATGDFSANAADSFCALLGIGLLALASVCSGRGDA